jgi:uncharacterized membrane protein SpoIIM required for sporulation
MNTILLATILQILIAFGIFNVWLVRSKIKTEYRGGSASNMKEEFEVYGLPEWFMHFVGFLKITTALLLIVGIFIPIIVPYIALLMSGLMVGAILMHVKIGDPFMKAMPAIGMLAMSTLLFCITYTF